MSLLRRAEARARAWRNVGGTSGGIGEFLIGLLLAAGGGYLLLSNVTVTSNPWSIYGHSAFGVILIPVFIGIAMLFFNGRSIGGWLLTLGGATAIFVGILSQMQIFFRPTSLLNTIIMLALLASGLGLVARSIRSHD